MQHVNISLHTVLNHDFVDESRGAVLMSCDVNLRCTMCGDMTHDINAKSQYFITHVLNKKKNEVSCQVNFNAL